MPSGLSGRSSDREARTAGLQASGLPARLEIAFSTKAGSCKAAQTNVSWRSAEITQGQEDSGRLVFNATMREDWSAMSLLWSNKLERNIGRFDSQDQPTRGDYQDKTQDREEHTYSRSCAYQIIGCA